METHRAAHGGHAEGIAVTANAGNHAGNQMPRLRMFWIAEAQRVEAGDRPRAHGEDVAQDATDAGCRTLIGLDVARMIVALHLEDHCQPIANVDDARILTRPLDHPGRFRREPTQVNFRGFIGTMLVPHCRKDAELSQRRLASDQVEDALILVGLEPVFGHEFGGDAGLVGDHEARPPLPGAPPARRTARGLPCSRLRLRRGSPDAASCRAHCRAC